MSDSTEDARQAWRQLEQDWLDVHHTWHGVTFDKFEHRAWDPLAEETQRFYASLEALREKLDRVRQLPRP